MPYPAFTAVLLVQEYSAAYNDFDKAVTRQDHQAKRMRNAERLGGIYVKRIRSCFLCVWIALSLLSVQALAQSADGVEPDANTYMDAPEQPVQNRSADIASGKCGIGLTWTLDSGGKLLTLQKALCEIAPELKLYRRPSRKAAFLEEMLALFDELRSYEVTPEELAGKADQVTGATREKLEDLSLLYAAYESRLHRPGLDARDRMSKLCDHLEESG